MGLEQVGQCMFIEYGDDMILVDAGMEFASDHESLWADYIVPDIRYIKNNIHSLEESLFHTAIWITLVDSEIFFLN